MTAKDILLAVIIPLILAEVGPWCGWLAARLLPWAARLRYGDTERAAVRLEEWSGDLAGIPGQLTRLAYAVGQLTAGWAVSARRKSMSAIRTNAKTFAPVVELILLILVIIVDVIRDHVIRGHAWDPALESAVDDAIRSLPDPQRTAIELLMCGLSEAQVAERMGVSRLAAQGHTEEGLMVLRSVIERT